LLEKLLEGPCLIGAIVVDMDGTITKFNLDFLSARRRILKELDKMNRRTPDMTDQLSLYFIVEKLRDKTDPDTFRELRKMIYGMIEEMELKAATDVTLYPGAVDTLRKLRERSIRIGLVTNNGRKATEITLSRYQLNSLFDTVVTRDDCDKMKPAAEPVSKVLAALNVTPDKAVLIGDGVMDIGAARAAGVRSVAVATGPFKIDLLLTAEPDYLLSSINDLPTLIELLNATESKL
jgi:HAD superfamily hydrolase (TIGR01509 family)